MAKRKPKRTSPKPDRTWLFALLLLAVTALAYAPAWNGRPIWDDDAHLTKVELRSASGLARIWFEPGATQQYYPLVHCVFWLEQKIWDLAPTPYHFVNILLHATSAFLLFLFLRRLRIPGGWLAALLFALHPVQVESVAWISELKNTLSGVFYLSAALAYLRFDRERKRGAWFLAFALFLAALLSKTVVASLPAALLIVFSWERGKLSWRRDVLPLLPFFALALAAGLTTSWIEHQLIGAHGEAFDLSLGQRVLIAGRAFWFYLGKLFWPQKLTFIYPRWNVDPHLWWQWLFPLAAFALVIALWFLRRRTRGLLAAILFFGGTLFPVLGFLNVYPFIFSFVADHFQYLASIGIFTLLAAGFAIASEHLRFARAAAVLVLALLAFLTWQQAHIYADPITLYEATLRDNPDCWLAHNNLSTAYLARGRIDDALTQAELALAAKPNDVQPHISLGDVLLRKRRLDEAIAQYQAGLALRPDYGDGYSHLGSAFLLAHRYRDAIAQYEKALTLTRNSIAAHNNLAWLLATCRDVSLRDGSRAVALAQTAEKLSGGGNAVILHTLAAAYAQSGQIVAAISTAEEARALALQQGNTPLAGMLDKEIAQYRSHLVEP